MISVFTQNVIANAAPLMDPHQVAAIRGCTVEELDSFIEALSDRRLAEVKIWLADRNAEMQSLINTYDRLKCGARVTKVGDKYEPARPTRRTAANPKMAAAMAFQKD